MDLPGARIAPALPPSARSMRRGERRWWAWGAVLLAGVACGGGGSSGFDKDPSWVERSLIVESASALACLPDANGVEICAVGAPVTLAFDPPPPGAEPPPEAPLIAVSTVAEDCLEDARDCALAVRATLGVEVSRDSLLLFAVRPEDLSQPWRSARKAIRPAQIPENPVGFFARFEPGTAVMIAVAVFPPGTTPPVTPAEGLTSETLSEYGASLVGVVLGAVVPDFE